MSERERKKKKKKKTLQGCEKERKILSTNQPMVQWHQCQRNAIKWHPPASAVSDLGMDSSREKAGGYLPMEISL